MDLHEQLLDYLLKAGMNTKKKRNRIFKIIYQNELDKFRIQLNQLLINQLLIKSYMPRHSKLLNIQNVMNIKKVLLFFNWDSLNERLNSHYKAWSYKKKKYKKIKGNRKSFQTELTVNRCLLILDLKSFRSKVKGKHSIVENSGVKLCEERKY